MAASWQTAAREAVPGGSPGDPASPPGEGSGAGSAPLCPAGTPSLAAGSQQERFCATQRGKAGVSLWKNCTIRPTVE